MVGDPVEHGAQVRLGIEVIDLGGADEAVHRSSTLATGVRTHEEVVLSTQHRCSKASLQALECLVAGEGFVVGYAPESNSSQ
jgi:hypothetical protein